MVFDPFPLSSSGKCIALTSTGKYADFDGFNIGKSRPLIIIALVDVSKRAPVRVCLRFDSYRSYFRDIYLRIKTYDGRFEFLLEIRIKRNAYVKITR